MERPAGTTQLFKATVKSRVLPRRIIGGVLLTLVASIALSFAWPIFIALVAIIGVYGTALILTALRNLRHAKKLWVQMDDNELMISNYQEQLIIPWHEVTAVHEDAQLLHLHRQATTITIELKLYEDVKALSEAILTHVPFSATTKEARHAAWPIMAKLSELVAIKNYEKVIYLNWKRYFASILFFSGVGLVAMLLVFSGNELGVAVTFLLMLIGIWKVYRNHPTTLSVNSESICLHYRGKKVKLNWADISGYGSQNERLVLFSDQTYLRLPSQTFWEGQTLKNEFIAYLDAQIWTRKIPRLERVRAGYWRASRELYIAIDA